MRVRTCICIWLIGEHVSCIVMYFNDVDVVGRAQSSLQSSGSNNTYGVRMEGLEEELSIGCILGGLVGVLGRSRCTGRHRLRGQLWERVWLVLACGEGGVMQYAYGFHVCGWFWLASFGIFNAIFKRSQWCIRGRRPRPGSGSRTGPVARLASGFFLRRLELQDAAADEGRAISWLWAIV